MTMRFILEYFGIRCFEGVPKGAPSFLFNP